MRYEEKKRELSQDQAMSGFLIAPGPDSPLTRPLLAAVKPRNRDLDTPLPSRKLPTMDPDAKAILPEPRSFTKIPYQVNL